MDFRTALLNLYDHIRRRDVCRWDRVTLTRLRIQTADQIVGRQQVNATAIEALPQLNEVTA